MKGILFVLALFISVSGFSQTRTEKYNSLMERYEYFDNNGVMVGYKKYNSLKGQWEYYEANRKRNSNRTKQEYIQPYDFNLIYKTLAYKQKKYDNNVDVLRAKVDYLNKLFQVFFDYKDNPKVKKRLNRILELRKSYSAGLEKINDTNADFSKNSTAQNIINWLNQYETRLTSISREIEQDKSVEPKKNTNTNYTTAKGYLFKTTFDNPPFEMSLYSEPNVSSTVRYKCPKNSEVIVIDNSGKIFFKVVVDGYSGFVSKHYLKRQW